MITLEFSNKTNSFFPLIKNKEYEIFNQIRDSGGMNGKRITNNNIDNFLVQAGELGITVEITDSPFNL